MSVNYVITNIYNFINRFYNIKTIVTKIDTNQFHFDLGNIGAFVLKTDAFKTEADLNAFKIGLSARLNNALIPALG